MDSHKKTHKKWNRKKKSEILVKSENSKIIVVKTQPQPEKKLSQTPQKLSQPPQSIKLPKISEISEKLPKSEKMSKDVVVVKQIAGDEKKTQVTVQSKDHTKPVGIDMIYYINLDSRGDRREHMEDQLRQFNIPFQRKSAYKFSSYEEAKASPEFHDYLTSHRVVEHQEERKHGFVISCFLSHLSLYKQIAQMNVDGSNGRYFLILEDDVNIPYGWEERFAQKIKSVPYDFDVLRIGYWAEARDEDRINDDVYMARPPFRTDYGSLFYAGTHAVVVQSQTIHRLIAKLEGMNIDDADAMLTSCCDQLQSYVLTEKIIERWDNPSDHPSRVAAKLKLTSENKKLQPELEKLETPKSVGKEAPKLVVKELPKSVVKEVPKIKK